MRSDHTHDVLEKAIIKTIAYADIFNYPLTLAEIHRYLIETPATLNAVQQAVDDLISAKKLIQINDLYCFHHRAETIHNRLENALLAKEAWPIAIEYGQLIGKLPFVRMVAVTGSLAVDNIDANGDIDYMIVTEPKYLWLCRLFIIGLVKWVERLGFTLCPNYIITENALPMLQENLFTAREIVQMVPITGQATYALLRQHNQWTNRFFPNASDSPSPIPPSVEYSWRKRSAEVILRNPLSRRINHWEMIRKIRKFQQQNPGAIEADFSPDQCKGHFDGHMQRVLESYQQRVDLYLAPVHTLPTEEQASIVNVNHKKTKLLFGQSYYLRFDEKLWASMQPYPPLGTLYAASYMREHGYDVALFDAMLATSESEWATRLDHEKPDFAIIYEDNFNYLSKMCLTRMREAAFTMIAMAKQRNCTVIVCGSDATDHYADYLEAGADYILIGEGEETLQGLMTALTNQPDVAHEAIIGVVSKQQQQPTRRPVIKSLDTLPPPAWDLVDIDRYKAIWYQHHGYYAMNMATTRGCPYHCNWCAKPIWGQRYNVHSPEQIVAQMKTLHENYQPDYIWFADDIMGLKPGWIERFADLLEAENLHIPFKCLSRADLLLKGNTIDGLKRAGCDIVWIGAESGSQKILDAMEKGTQVEHIRETAAKLHAAGVRVGFFLQFGYPGETRADIAATLQLVRDCQPDDIGISVSYPLPGTIFHQRVKDQLGAQHNWADSNDMAMLYAGPFTTAFYRQLHTVVHKEFRSRQTLSRLKHALTNPGSFKKSYLRDTAAMVYHTLTLPMARIKLNSLSQAPNPSPLVLKGNMDYARAATPTPQGDD